MIVDQSALKLAIYTLTEMLVLVSTARIGWHFPGSGRRAVVYQKMGAGAPPRSA